MLEPLSSVSVPVPDGPAVVLVHGFAGSTHDWEPAAIPRLAATHRVVAVDLLGMGFSARDDDLAYGWGPWADQVADVMDALGVPTASLVGQGLGGAVASIVAGERAERVERLVLVAPLVPLEQSERPWLFKLLEIPGAGELVLGTADRLPTLPGFDAVWDARAAAAFRRRGTRSALLAYVRHGRDTPRLASAYRRIRAPTLVVHGTADDVVPWAAVRRSVTAIDGVTVLPIDGARHWLLRDAPDRVLGAVGAFLGG